MRGPRAGREVNMPDESRRDRIQILIGEDFEMHGLAALIHFEAGIPRILRISHRWLTSRGESPGFSSHLVKSCKRTSCWTGTFATVTLMRFLNRHTAGLGAHHWKLCG